MASAREIRLRRASSGIAETDHAGCVNVVHIFRTMLRHRLEPRLRTDGLSPSGYGPRRM